MSTLKLSHGLVVVLLSALCLLSPGSGLRAADDSAIRSKPELVCADAVAEDGLPPYDYPIQDGLYATITAFNGLEETKIRQEEELKLDDIPGFKKDLRVRVIWQEKKEAPLVVLLLGLATRAKAPLAQHWKAVMQEAGCHVLTFDSVFLPSFSERSQHGVAGNVLAEARLVSHIIESFLRNKKAKDRVTRLGVVGGSYGGVLALNLARLVRQGKSPLLLDALLAFSPPANMETAARLLDRFHEQDRWQFTLAELGGDLLGHKPVPAGEPIPFSTSEMRAGIAAAFRIDLTEVVNQNDRIYQLNKLPKGEGERDHYREDVAETWTFTRFIEEMAFPYWRTKNNLSAPKDLWAAGRLEEILPDCPGFVKVVIAEDDPLNDPREIAQLQSGAPAGMLQVLPRGGHMGYVNTAWAKARMQRLFKDNSRYVKD